MTDLKETAMPKNSNENDATCVKTSVAEEGLHRVTHFDEKAPKDSEIEENDSEKITDFQPAFIKPDDGDEAKNWHDDIREKNHALITKAIHELMCSSGRIPTKTEIAIKTGISRQAVQRHLKGFSTNPKYVEEDEQFQIITSNVMAKVYEHAMYGDARAARLYFEMTGKLNAKKQEKQNENI